MVKIEGTYTSVRSPTLAGFYEKMGIPKEIVDKLIGSHWSMTVWPESPKKWGYYFTCQEMPELNLIDIAEEGEEKVVTNELFGGINKILFTRNGDDFTSTFDSERCGKYSCKESYGEKGIKNLWSIQGSDFDDSWARSSDWSGSYSTVVTNNLEAYYDTLGPAFIENAKKYKAKFWQVGNEFKFLEYFGDAGHVLTILKLDEEVQFYIPGEDNAVPTDRRAKLSQKSLDTFLLSIKNPDLKVEEWTITFLDNKLKMSALELSSGKTCWLELERFVDVTGTYTPVASQGYDEFASAFGLGPETKKDERKTSITVKENGENTFDFIWKKEETESKITVKVGEEFEFDHPLFKHLKSFATLKNNVLQFTNVTENGQKFTETLTFRDSFFTVSIVPSDSNVTWTIINEQI